MPFTQGIVNSFFAEAIAGIHVIPGDTLKLALYTDAVTLGPTTTAYAATGEVSGAGYTAGGKALSNVTVSTVSKSGKVVTVVDADDPVWISATITARGALIYNASKANRAISVLDLGGLVGVVNGTLTITLPDPAGATPAFVQLQAA